MKDKPAMATLMATLIVMVAGFLSSSFAQADEGKSASRQETVGVGSGAVIGAVAGGPVGFIVGAAFGGWLGDRFFQRTEERDQYLTQLTGTQTELATMNTQLRSVEQELMLSTERQLDDEARWTETLARSVNISVLFKTGETNIDEETQQRLGELAGLINDLGPVVVDVEGHADARGAEEFNEQLSAERAAAVRDILVRNGVEAERISAVALGEAFSGGEEADADQHALDRRVEIRLDIRPTDRVAHTD